MDAAPDVSIVWEPLPGSQEAAISCPCDHILYEGTRGPGKTDAQLMFFRKHVGVGYGAFWRGIIFDREYKHLDDIVAKSNKWFPKFKDGAKFLSGKGDYRWVWPTGEQLLFRALSKEDHYWGFHGQEFPFIGWNELTKYPTPKCYSLMMSCNRSSFLPQEHSPDTSKPLPEIPLVVFSTTNPRGPGRNWVKRKFVDSAQPGEIVNLTTRIFNPRTQRDEDITRTQVRIFGSWRENRYLSPAYIAELHNTSDDNTRRAWVDGDWNTTSGGALDDLWRDETHVVTPFNIPRAWRIDRAFDWGSTKPFACLWFAEASGEDVTLSDGSVACPVRGSLFVIAELYGSRNIGENEGLKMSARDVALGIKVRERKMMDAGLIQSAPQPGPADNAISAVAERDTDSIEKKMAAQGVRWTASDKAAGTRKVGLQLVRDRLAASLSGEAPGLYIFSTCKAALETLPSLPRDPDDLDDVDTEAEDHIYDALRYRLLAAPGRPAVRLPVSFPT